MYKGPDIEGTKKVRVTEEQTRRRELRSSREVRRTRHARTLEHRGV